MAYQVLDRRGVYTVKTITYADTVEGNYTLTQNDYSLWLKVDTTDGQISLVLPDGLSDNYYNIVEKTGAYRVAFSPASGQQLEAQYDYIGITYNTGHLFYEGAGTWRLQGGLGDMDLNSLTDVVVPSQALADRKVLGYSSEVDKMILISGVPRRFYYETTSNYVTDPDHHGIVVTLDTTSANLTVSLEDSELYALGWNVQMHNLGPGDVIISTSGVFKGTPKTKIPPGGRAEAELYDVGTWLLWGDLINV